MMSIVRIEYEAKVGKSWVWIVGYELQQGIQQGLDAFENSSEARSLTSDRKGE